MVALPAEQLAERVAGQGTGPRIVRDLGVGIVRPDRVHGEEEEDSRIGDPGEDQYGLRGWPRAVEGEKIDCAQIERPLERSHPDVATESVDGDSSVRQMSGNTRLRSEGDQDDTEVVVLHERLGVLATRRRGFVVELLEFSREIELQERAGHGWRVRSAVLTVFVMSVRHCDPLSVFEAWPIARRSLRPPSLTLRSTSTRGPPELGLERLGFGAELEGVLRIGRRGAPGLVARGRGLALLADDSGRTAALHAAPEHRAAGDALLAAVRVVGELHGRRAAGLRQLPHGGDAVPRQRPGRGRGDEVPAVAVELLLGLPADLLAQGLQALREREVPSVPEDHDGADALALRELDGGAVLLLLVARVVADGVAAAGILPDQLERGGDAAADRVVGVEQVARAAGAALVHRAERGLVRAVALDVLVAHGAHGDHPQRAGEQDVAGPPDPGLTAGAERDLVRL